MKTSNTFPELASITDFLEQERGQTNDSLTTERKKTDESLFGLRRKTERETDLRVRKDREEVDQARAQRHIAMERDMAVNKIPHEQKLADDKSVQSERSSMDAAIRNERDQKDAVLNGFLQRERKETDENLLRERARTDNAVLQSSKLLTEEVELHLQTRAELTTRDEFLAIVSHDLRNPIGAIMSCTEMLLEDSSYIDMGSESKYWVQFIRRSAETSLRLISDILDMERIVEGKLQLQTGEHDLGVVIREATDSFVHIASAKRILLRAIIPAKETLVSFDRDRIAQVLSNLIGNALKFTPEGGSVILKVQRTEREIECSIHDTGPGIPNEKKNQIFDRYAQLGNKDRGGLGLGLYISKTLIESHKGRLWVESSPGKGSSFYFTLPAVSKGTRD